MGLDEPARALRSRDALRARVLYLQLQELDPQEISEPTLTDAIERAIAASVVELLAARSGRRAPAWTRRVPTLSSEFVLVNVRLPDKLGRLRNETPPELRARNLVAPERFLVAGDRAE